MPSTPTPDSTSITLTQATHLGRLTVKYGAIALVLMMVGRIFLGAVIAYWKAANPPPPPPPTVGFGILPPLSFPTQDETETVTSYVLETPTGTTPNFGDRAKVFLMIRSTPSLLADQEARQVAAKYDFLFEPEVLSSETYRWSKTQPLSSQLELDIVTKDFSFTTEYVSRPELFSKPDLPDDFAAVQIVKNFLSRADLLPNDVATAAGEVVYLKALGGELSPAVSFSDADFIQVDLNRTPIDNQYRMFGAEGLKGTIHAVVSGSLGKDGSIVALDFTYQPIDYSEVHTYPLRTSQQAWQVLKAGEGYVADRGETDQAIIRKVSLGYYESPEEQDYLQPIYVFEGDGGFLAYVPAIDSKYLQAN